MSLDEKVQSAFAAAWRGYIEAVIEEPDDYILDCGNHSVADMFGIVAAFITAAAGLTQLSLQNKSDSVASDSEKAETQ